jgi:sortase A
MPSPLAKLTKDRQGLILILIGGFFMLIFFSWRFYQARILSFSGDVPQVGIHKGAKPVSIQIPSINLKLAIEEAIIKDSVWQVSETGANHLNQSAYPGDGGNIVIYGHNKNSLFGPIRWLEKGAEIELTDEKGEKHLYKVVETTEVSPDNLQYILPKDEETLTLYTCSGLFDSKRFIVVAKP